ncbi:hypothetical protein AKJ43_03825 [candidate division MSBL1 archaeon SCGC-AAA261D19]|uniref:Uncharacterized protein n=1 Tax=candidate division MSBL1 archaeon SCGC-AAA261D19 TaxID=1698273 RepID=A0A133V3C3_9EURY|nr:hypothetical protein AKJ43_03825 [candidate division MSBL1 archaeon SCGC-AAA261D19]
MELTSGKDLKGWMYHPGLIILDNISRTNVKSGKALSTKSGKAGQVSVSAVVGIVIVVAIVSGSLAYLSAPTGTSKEDVKNYLETASDKDIKEVLAAVSGELFK